MPSTGSTARLEFRGSAPLVVAITDPVDGQVREFAAGLQFVSVIRVGTYAAGEPTGQVQSATAFARLPTAPLVDRESRP